MVLITHEHDVAAAAQRIVHDPRRSRAHDRRRTAVPRELARHAPHGVRGDPRCTVCVRASPCSGSLIGIAAVILTVGLGEGAQSDVRAQINALGSNLLIISPGSSTSTGGVRGGFGSASTLSVSDADALASKTVAPDIAAVAPHDVDLGIAHGVARRTGRRASSARRPTGSAVRARTLERGRFLTAADERSRSTRSWCWARPRRRSSSATPARSARRSPSTACSSRWSACSRRAVRRARRTRTTWRSCRCSVAQQRLFGGTHAHERVDDLRRGRVAVVAVGRVPRGAERAARAPRHRQLAPAPTSRSPRSSRSSPRRRRSTTRSPCCSAASPRSRCSSAASA